MNALPAALAQMHDLLPSEPDMEVLIHAESADDALEAMRGLPHRLGASSWWSRWAWAASTTASG